MGGPPDRWWPSMSFQFTPVSGSMRPSVGNHFRYMMHFWIDIMREKPSLAPHEKTKRTKFGKGGWKISLPMMKSDFSLCPPHACMCMYVCMHASMLSVCLSIFLSIHLCISALVHSSIPCKTEIFADKRWWGAFDPSSKQHFSPGYVWTFFGPPPKKNLQSYPCWFQHFPEFIRKSPSRMLPRCSSNANQQLPQRSTTTHNLRSPISIAVDGSINRW